MDYLLSLTYSLLFLISLAPLYFLLKRRHVITFLPNLPPGSFGWPVLGETLEFLSENPEAFVHKRLKKHSTSVFKTNILGENMLVFSGAEANKLITANEQKLVRVWLPLSQRRLFGLERPKTAPLGLSRLFVLLKPDQKSVGKFDHVMKHHLRKLCESEVKVIRAYDLAKSFVLSLSCGHFLGMSPERAVERLTGRFDDIVNGVQSVHVAFPWTRFYRARRAAEAVMREIDELAREKRRAGALEEDDVLAVLAGRDGEVSPEVANIVMGIMGASYGSVVTAITFMVKFVGERPDVYHKIYSGDYVLC